MIGIETIGSYIPAKKISNLNKSSKNFDDSFIKNKIGMEAFAIKDRDQETSDLCLNAYNNLPKKTMSNIECIVVCTQNPDGYGLPHTSAILHQKLGLDENCAAFDISLGCSGYVYSLSIIKSFMIENNLRNGLLFTCDPYSKIVDRKDNNTGLLFGDAATVTLISENPKWAIGISDWGTRGAAHDAIKINDNNVFTMNGRAVFNFAVQTIPKSIEKTLKKNNISIDDIDIFLLHQASKYVIEIIRKRLKVDEAHLPFKAKNYGNTVSSSIPLLLEELESNFNNIIISGFGVGLSWGTTLLSKISTVSG